MTLLQLKLKKAEESNCEDLEEIYPRYGSDGAAAFDLKADLKGRDIKYFDKFGEPHTAPDCDHFILEPEERVLIPTGFIFEIPVDHQMNIMSRSGLTWKNGIIVLNAPAVIDHDYTNETFIVLYNSSKKGFKIEHGMRIAQAQLNVVNRVALGSLGGRNGGFGSTGKK